MSFQTVMLVIVIWNAQKTFGIISKTCFNFHTVGMSLPSSKTL